MPRRSPRARRSSAANSRLPGKGRPRATPGRTRSASRRQAATSARPAAAKRHLPKGARDIGTSTPPAARKRATIVRDSRRAPRFRPPEPERVAAILDILARTYPDARTALNHENALQLLIATILSAQCTDAREIGRA